MANIRPYVADGLSLLRILSTFAVLLFSLFGAWEVAFITLALGWATDLLDGKAARADGWGSGANALKVMAAYSPEEAERIETNSSRLDRLDLRFVRLAQGDPDGTADTVLGFGSSFVMVMYFIINSEGKLAIMAATCGLLLWLGSIATGLLMVKAVSRDPESRHSRTRQLVAFNMAVFHGLFQIGLTTVWFAYMAYGGWVVMLTILILLGVTVMQYPKKISLWREGRLTPRSA